MRSYGHAHGSTSPKHGSKAARAALRGGPMSDLRSAARSSSARRQGSSITTKLSMALNFALVVYLISQHSFVRTDDPRASAGGAAEAHAAELVLTTEKEVQAVKEALGTTLETLHQLPKGALASRNGLNGLLRGGGPSAAQGAVPEQATQPRPVLQVGSGAGGHGKAWLTIGIPTVPRRQNMDYLTETIESLLSELPLDPTDPFYGRIKVVVMNNKPGEHVVFENLRHRLEGDSSSMLGRKAEVYLMFRDNPGTLRDPRPDLPDPDDLNNPTNRPGREVRKQTCDLITLMKLAEPMSHYYLFMEDDFHVCPHAIRQMHYAVRKMSVVSPQWLALRVSYGMNGILLRTLDLRSLHSYLWDNVIRLPPDLLWQEWYAGRRPELARQIQGRQLHVYKYNLLDHIGTVSSFAVRPDRPKWPGCFDSMARVWSLQKSEQFDARRCGGTDVSPCPASDPGLEEWTAKLISF